MAKKAAPPVNDQLAEMNATDALLGAAAIAADQAPQAVPSPGPQNDPASPPPGKIPTAIGNCTIHVPLLDGAGYAQTHIDRRLRPHQAAILRRVQNALVRKGYRLKDGREVKNAADALCWILEQMIEGQP